MELCLNARQSARVTSTASTEIKNEVLLRIADLLNKEREPIKSANRKDLRRAEESGMEHVLVERMKFGDDRIDGRIRSLRKIAALPDPVGQIDDYNIRPNGMKVGRMRTPLGVILMIYEARPHVTINAAAFCIKSGNAVILKGGSEVLETNKTLGELITSVLREFSMPPATVQIVSSNDRSLVRELLMQDADIDLVIPRGGEGLIRYVNENSRIPVIKHYRGVCHCYVHESAEMEKALDIVMDSKMLMPEVCNALESLLIDRTVAQVILPRLKKRADEVNLKLRGCEHTRSVIDIDDATEEDWSTEYLDAILSVKIVDGIDEAVSHIGTYGTGHTDTIVTENLSVAELFVRSVDSSVVLVNASTMFNDGEELGLGAEIGISTEKLHARGPMGLKELTSYKFVIYGNGHCKKF
jgi:glutamate-5-semialdehyde dehydrogenase